MKLAVVAEAKGKLPCKHEPGNCSNKQRLRPEDIPCDSNPDPKLPQDTAFMQMANNGHYPRAKQFQTFIHRHQ